MKSIREKLNFDPEFQNFILQKPTLSQESLNAYTMTLVNFIKFTDEPFYKTVQELRTLQNDRIENNMIIRFNPNQSRINTLHYEFIEFLRNQGCSNTSIESYVRSLRAILNTLGIILPKTPNFNSRPKDWYVLTKSDIKYVLDISTVHYKALINFAAVTGLRVQDIASLTVKDFMTATEEYHGCSEVDDFLDSSPEGMIGFWELFPHKTRRLNVPCKVCNTPESSDAILFSLNERVKYFEAKNEKEGLDLRIAKKDPLFANRKLRYKGFLNPHHLSITLGQYKHKLNAERERVFKYRYEQGEISKETYEESIETIPNFHAHGLRKFFITTLAQNRVDARISALMEGHKAPIATDSRYVGSDFLRESIKEEYLRCIPDLSFENVEVRFLTLDERKSLEEKLADLTEKNKAMEENIEDLVNQAIEERLEDVFSDWLVKRGY